VLKSAVMQAEDFVRKWAPGGPAHGLGERAGAQAHFTMLAEAAVHTGPPRDRRMHAPAQPRPPHPHLVAPRTPPVGGADQHRHPPTLSGPTTGPSAMSTDLHAAQPAASSDLCATRRALLGSALSLPALPALAWLSGAALLSGPARAQGAPALPVAPVANVPETFFGTVVNDPYRALEDVQSPPVQAWMRAHSDHAHATLRRIDGRDTLRARMEALDASAPVRVMDVHRLRGEVYVYQRRAADEDQFKVYQRRGLDGAERLVYDPEVLSRATGQPHAVNWCAPSPDGRWVAVGVSAAGSEDAALRFIDTATGRQVGPTIPRALFGAASWSPDSRELYFHRMQALPPGAPPTDKYQRSVAVVMRPGAGESGVKTLLQAGRDLDIPATEFPIIALLPDGRAVALVTDGVSPNMALWHSTLAALRAGRPHWQPLARKADGVVAAALHGERVFALTYRDAPRYRLVSGPLRAFNLLQAEDVLPQSARVLTNLALAQDGLYVEAREGNVKRLMKLALRAADASTPAAPGSAGTLAAPRDVALPVDGAFSLGFSTVTPLPGVLIDLAGWTRARQIYLVQPDGTVRNTGLQPAGPYDMPADIEATEVMVRSHDGAMVPMSILHKRGIARDGSHPTLLYGYASYGFTEEPFFSPTRLAWLEQGGVFAVANPRGSGVFGREWHEAGKQATKPNTWRDFIACAEHLVRAGWTRPQRLGIWGGSAGGILVGMAMVERPDLFAAVVASVGSLDKVRSETTPNGVPNIPEFGTRTTEAGFRALLAMSTYHQIRDGVAYPAVLLTHGVNDPRVEVWHSTKTAARLLAASTSGRPVLVRLDWAAGHGIGDTKTQVLDERADLFSFLMWQMGMPGWAPRA
jgi:prolyl oligopeptidase